VHQLAERLREQHRVQPTPLQRWGGANRGSGEVGAAGSDWLGYLFMKCVVALGIDLLGHALMQLDVDHAPAPFGRRVRWRDARPRFAVEDEHARPSITTNDAPRCLASRVGPAGCGAGCRRRPHRGSGRGIALSGGHRAAVDRLDRAQAIAVIQLPVLKTPAERRIVVLHAPRRLGLPLRHTLRVERERPLDRAAGHTRRDQPVVAVR
jgi:hypothetical protein